MTTIPATTPRPGRRTPVRSAGVLAHGLHAVADHIFTRNLTLLTMDVSYRADGACISVLVLDHQLAPWLDSVDAIDGVCETWTGASGNIHTCRKVRLGETCVVIELRSVERPTALTAVPA